jgi:hypothetical protein
MEQYREREFERRLLNRIFKHKRNEEREGSRKMQNEELHRSFCSPNTVRILK